MYYVLVKNLRKFGNTGFIHDDFDYLSKYLSIQIVEERRWAIAQEPRRWLLETNCRGSFAATFYQFFE